MSGNKKKKNMPRQDWNPHWTVSTLYRVLAVLFSILKVAVGAVVTVLLIGIVCGFVFVGTLGDYLQEDVLPMANVDIEGYQHKQNSYMYYLDENSQLQIYQKLFAETSSEWASYEDIPQAMIDAAIAIEDHRFLEHQGVDWVTTLKACARMFFGDSSAGGSTITQQLIKNILLSTDETADDVTVQRKMLEIFRAVQLEKSYDKKTIIERYLNVIYLGQGCYGVRSAAATYFGKEVEMLTPAECASIISITNNPSLFDPYGRAFKYKAPGAEAAQEMTGRERNRSRQLLVLRAMKEYGMLTEEQYQEAVNQELVFKNGIDNEDRLAQCPNESCGYKNTVSTFVKDGENYYCPQCNTLTAINQSASQDNYSWFADTVLDEVARAFAEKSGMAYTAANEKLFKQQVCSGGYQIYTTIDMKVQNQIDKIYTNLEEIPDTRSGQQLQSAIVVLDNRTGDVVGLAGGVGEKTGFDEYNRATEAERQSGSSFKPIAVYAPAFELGAINPATVIKDMPVTYNMGAYPQNDNRRYSYSRTILSGITSSVNAVAGNTLMEIGEGYAFDFAKEKFGVHSLIEERVLEDGRVLSDISLGPLALGAQTYGVTVREMADAFGTFANNGTFRKSRTFTKVYDSEGNLVLDNTQETRDILSQKTVDYMNYCLVSATHDGTGSIADLAGMGITTAGKTGTTGDNKDRYYCGYTGYYTAAVWTGFDKPESLGLSFNPSAKLWKKVMGPLHSGKSDRSLYDNGKMTTASVCLDSGKAPTAACQADIRGGRIGSAKVYPEDRPTEACTKHVLVDYCSGGGVATEYCQHFAEVDPSVTIGQRGLVKMTQDEINEILMAEPYRLHSEFLDNRYVYLINSDGSDGVFKGFHGDCNEGVNAPYAVCPVHTKEAWEKYQQAQKPEPEEPTLPGGIPFPHFPGFGGDSDDD